MRGPTSLAPAVWLSAALAALIAALGVIGADALWLVPLGDRIAHGHLPGSIPYATAPPSGWHDVPALGHLIFWAAYHTLGGERGLVVLQTLAAAVGIGALARGVGQHSSAGAAGFVSILVIIGSLPAIAVTNVSLFSLALFPILLGLLEAQSVVRSGHIWLAVPLLAVWGNLHGAVLVGWGLLACYLVLARWRHRPIETSAILATAALAIFANAAHREAPHYYWSVFHNEAARQGVGLWSHLSASAFDVLLVVVFAAFAAIAVRRRGSCRLWEIVAIAGLAASTVDVARNGVWLLMVAAYPAARALSFRGPRPRLLAVVAGAVTVAVFVGLFRSPPDPGSRRLARVAARSGAAVLAEPVLGQQVVLAGGRVWVDNPLDAFRAADQRLYVDWFSGRRAGADAVRHADLVLVRRRSAAGRVAARDRRLVLLSSRGGAALYRVRASS
jgi:hypothetical protein